MGIAGILTESRVSEMRYAPISVKTSAMTESSIESEAGSPGDILLCCDDVSVVLEFFRERLGFRLESIYPAKVPENSFVISPK